MNILQYSGPHLDPHFICAQLVIHIVMYCNHVTCYALILQLSFFHVCLSIMIDSSETSATFITNQLSAQ